jgi:hypothetical protein
MCVASGRGGRGVGNHGSIAICIGRVGTCAFTRSHLVIMEFWMVKNGYPENSAV